MSRRRGSRRDLHVRSDASRLERRDRPLQPRLDPHRSAADRDVVDAPKAAPDIVLLGGNRAGCRVDLQERGSRSDPDRPGAGSDRDGVLRIETRAMAQAIAVPSRDTPQTRARGRRRGKGSANTGKSSVTRTAASACRRALRSARDRARRAPRRSAVPADRHTARSARPDGNPVRNRGDRCRGHASESEMVS